MVANQQIINPSCCEMFPWTARAGISLLLTILGCMKSFLLKIEDYASDDVVRFLEHCPFVKLEKLDGLNHSINRELLGKTIKAVQSLFWGQSSYAVVFCALRDHYKYGENATLFEDDIDAISKIIKLDFPCPPNTIATSFYNNSYLKLPVSRWDARRVKARSFKLVQAVVNEVDSLLKKQ